MPVTPDARVDAYIAKSQPFAQPILNDLRAAIHRAAPNVIETMKWSMPFFTLTGPSGKPVILGNMAAFKAHCSFGLWGAAIAAQIRADGVAADDSVEDRAKGTAMGSFGRIESQKDLPPPRKLQAYIKQAAAAIESGERVKSLDARRPAAHRVARAELAVPPELEAALKKSAAARKTFTAFAPSCRREYVEWIASAKRDETKAARVAQAVEWMAAGKRRNWKYEAC